VNGYGYAGDQESVVGGIGDPEISDLALCAVLMDEWLKELAAIAQEQSVVLVTEQPSL